MPMDPLFIVTCWGRDWGPISITDAIKGRKSAPVRVVVNGNLLFIYVFTLYFSFPHLLAEATIYIPFNSESFLPRGSICN